ncbi:hypothetical protein D3C78_1787790 [compost metagenome]
MHVVKLLADLIDPNLWRMDPDVVVEPENPPQGVPVQRHLSVQAFPGLVGEVAEALHGA